jgi:arylsulfatase A-like enzyme
MALVLSSTPAAARPNIVVFVADDLGVMDVGAYNRDTFYETPNIDRLAARGAVFTNAYAASPVCSPSRYALLTGRHPTRVAATEWFHTGGAPHRVARFGPAASVDDMALDEVTLGEAFRTLGYQTWFVGKWHLGEQPDHWPEAQGFDVNIGGYSRGSPETGNGAGGFFPPYANPRLSDGPPREYLERRLAGEAVNLIGTRRPDRPFLLFYAFYGVHTPLQAPAELVTKYRAKAAKLTDAKPDFAPEEQVWPVAAPRQVRTRQNHPTYAAMVEAMDEGVGRVVAELERQQLRDETIIVFTSDNGGLSSAEGSPTSNLPLRGGKGWLYEGGIRAPLIIVVPGAKGPRRLSAPAVGMDVMPTLAELAGAPQIARTATDGRSLAPVLNGHATLRARDLYWHYPHYSNQGGFPGAAIRQGRWKLIERFEDGQRQLYDLETDPGEQTNLVAKEPRRATAMLARLHRWYRQTGARFLEGPDAWRPGQLTQRRPPP